METFVDKTAFKERRPQSLAEFRRDGGHVLPDDVKRRFRDGFPVLLDGALSQSPISGFFLRQARRSLASRDGGQRTMSSAILRETLESVVAQPTPSTGAGLVAIGPKRARVWWDPAAIDNLDDVIAGLDRPRPVLRFYDITGLDAKAGRWHNVFDIDVDIGARGRTVDFWAADRTYAVELGFVHADGLFLRLARTNLAKLPRDGKGEAANAGVSRSNLPPRLAGARAEAFPDAADREWVERRPDSQRRDLEAELIIHMLYKAFLASGPRALRSAPAVSPREPDVLRREFIQRRRRRDRVDLAQRPSGPPRLLIADLGRPAPVESNGTFHYLPSPPLAAFPGRSCPSASEFVYFRDLSAAFRSGLKYQPGAPDLVRRDPARNGPLPSPTAEPVFEAAERLRRRLSQLSSTLAETATAKKPFPAAPRFGAGGSARCAFRSDVGLARMALTLEGRMRPGARLRVAGKLVRADADGRFRVECAPGEAKREIPLPIDSGAREPRGMVGEDRDATPRKRKAAFRFANREWLTVLEGEKA